VFICLGDNIWAYFLRALAGENPHEEEHKIHNIHYRKILRFSVFCGFE